MKKVSISHPLSILVGLALVLAACGGGTEIATTEEVAETPVTEDEPTQAPEPTATTEPTPEPTATTEPTPEPTATPEPEPTPEPTATPEPEPTETEVPTATPEPAADEPRDQDEGADNRDDETSEDRAANAVSDLGAQVYATSCANCHGTDGQGTNRGPALTGIGRFFVDDVSPIVGLVTNGGTAMPEFGSKLSVQEIDAVVQYVVETF